MRPWPKMLPVATYEALEVPTAERDFLPRLERVLTSTAEPAHEKSQELVTAVAQGGDPTALISAILPGVSAEDRDGYQRARDWKYGSYLDRLRLYDRLAGHAIALHQDSSPDAQSYARAVFLLWSQEAFRAGAAQMRKLLRDDAFVAASGWAVEQLQAVAGMLDDYDANTATFVKGLVVAVRAMERMIAAETVQSLDRGTAELLEALSQMIELSVNRPEIAWRVANLTWRAISLLRADNAQDQLRLVEARVEQWRQQNLESDFDRWLQEAVQSTGARPRSAGVRIIDAGKAAHLRVQPNYD